MTNKTVLACFLALMLGAVVGGVVKVGYALPGFLPTADLFMFILDSPVGKMALRVRGGEGGVMIAIAVRALTCSVLVGIIAGVFLRKIRFKRVFCYAVLWVPLMDFVIGYLQLHFAYSSLRPEQVAAGQKNFGQIVWADLWVYGWFFLALYVSYAIANRIASKRGPYETK